MIVGSSSIFLIAYEISLKICFQADLGRQNSAITGIESSCFWLLTHRGHGLRPIFMLWSVKIWQVSSCRKFIQHLEPCLLWQPKLTEYFVNLWCFLLSFPTGCLKWNTAAINSLLWFMAGLFIEFLVGKCAGCQSWKSDFGCIVFVFHLAGCGVEKSLKRFWPYLIAFKSCISNGKPE